MGKTKTQLPEITAEINDQLNFLQNLSGQVSILKCQLSKMTDKLKKYSQNAGNTDRHLPADTCNSTSGRICKIIPFPEKGVYKTITHSSNRKTADSGTKRFQAAPGEQLSEGIHDFRPILQRDGLILLAWDKRSTEMGERYTAYWVTSVGIPRYYASKQCAKDDFPMAQPDHKSYAAEDGIEFYGQEAPIYLVHVAPELLMSNPRHAELRAAHIRNLIFLQNDVDYNYKYLLTKEKKRSALFNGLEDNNPIVAGA